MSKIKAETYLESIGNDICSPFFDRRGLLHVLLQDAGDILMFPDSGRIQRVHSTSGQPSGAIYDPNGLLYVTDFAHGSVLVIQQDGRQDSVVEVYEDKPLKGPSNITADSKGTIYFTDSGPLGETGLHSPTGSLFMIANSLSGKMLKPVSLETLAAPSALTLSPDGKFIYVAEMMANRVIRYFQQPEGVFHGSVFYQLSGGIGPSCLSCDKQGSIYIGQYDTRDSSSEGSVYVVSKSGKLISTIATSGAEISGLVINDNYLFITEKSTGSIQRVAL